MNVVAKEEQRSVRNIPNLISVGRILAIPVVLVFLSFPGPVGSFWAALVFSIAATTDLLDGYIARYQKQETYLGKLLDPLADKLLILSCMIMLIPMGRVPAWMAVVIIGREMAVTGLRGIASADGVIISASKRGKAKLIFQSISLIALILHYKYLGIDFHELGMLLLWIALFITLWSAVDYFKYFYHRMQE